MPDRSSIGYGGTVFGVANVCTNGYTVNVDLATNYQPKEGWVFNAWLVDDSYEGSGYPLVMGKVLEQGTLSFEEIQTNARTWTDIVVTQQPARFAQPVTILVKFCCTNLVITTVWTIV